MDDLYQENILDHYKNPHNFGEVANPTNKIEETNASCGDRLLLSVRIENDQIVDIKFQGVGCALSIASASMLTDELIGKPVVELKLWTKEKLIELIGIEVSPTREKCVLLSLKALRRVGDE